MVGSRLYVSIWGYEKWPDFSLYCESKTVGKQVKPKPKKKKNKNKNIKSFFCYSIIIILLFTKKTQQ